MKLVRSVLFVALSLLPAASLYGQAAAPATQPALREEAADVAHPKVRAGGANDPGFMRTHTQYVAKAKAGNVDLYMEGDSITDFWERTHKQNWNKNFAGWKAGDFGISGDRTQHVLWRIENGELDGVTPKVIVLLIGTNNLTLNAVYAANTVDETFKGYQSIVNELTAREPQAKLLLIGVMPRQDKRAGQDNAKLNTEIVELNTKIAPLADGTRIKYLNFNDKLADASFRLVPGVMNTDNLHPSDKGYDIWADAMRPILTQWLGPPAATTQP